MANLINEIIVRQLSDEFARAEGLVVVSVKGLTVAETETLRESLAETGLRLRIVRNRLARLALKNRGFDAPEDLFLGNVACAWGSSEEAISAAKVIQRSDARKAGKVAFQGGFFEDSLLAARETAALAELPGKQELRAMMLGVISAPARNLVGLVAAPGSSLARVLQARSEKAPAPAP
jgi:large subunit ribosomal protein L10